MMTQNGLRLADRRCMIVMFKRKAEEIHQRTDFPYVEPDPSQRQDVPHLGHIEETRPGWGAALIRFSVLIGAVVIALYGLRALFRFITS